MMRDFLRRRVPGSPRSRRSIVVPVVMEDHDDEELAPDRKHHKSKARGGKSKSIVWAFTMLLALCLVAMVLRTGLFPLILQSDRYVEDSEFLLPRHLEPGDMIQFRWRSDNTLIDPYAHLIGLPTKLTTEVREFAKRSGLAKAFREDFGEDVTDISSHILDLPGARGKWAVSTPGTGTDSNWANSNMKWFDAIDEEAFEETIQILRRGGFDTVLDAIGNAFDSKGLMIAGMGFIVVSQSFGGRIHKDDPGVGRGFFDFLFPITLPEHYSAQLFIGDERRVAPVNYTLNQGILMSGDTYHQTGDCDYRAHDEVRVAASVYVADLDDNIAHLLAEDGTALFPVPGNIEWLMAQKGRFWGGGKSMANDKGRKPYTAVDQDQQACPELAAAGDCDSDPWNVRPKCPKSCNIFIDDQRYFSEVIGASLPTYYIRGA